jgi:hypothetical protein
MGPLAAPPAGNQHPTDLGGGKGVGQRRGREGQSASPAGPKAR